MNDFKSFQIHLTNIILMLSLLCCLHSKFFPLTNIKNISIEISVY